MKKIRDTLSADPYISRINLSFLQLETLDDILFELCNFKNLKVLDISCNRIRRLPNDMSLLKDLEIIDISDNLIENVEATLLALNTLPSLKELTYNFSLSDLKNSIHKYLPRLAILNGEPLKAEGFKYSSPGI